MYWPYGINAKPDLWSDLRHYRIYTIIERDNHAPRPQYPVRLPRRLPDHYRLCAAGIAFMAGGAIDNIVAATEAGTRQRGINLGIGFIITGKARKQFALNMARQIRAWQGP